LTLKETGDVLHIHAISRCILADDQQLFHAALKQSTRLFEHIANRAAYQVATHGRDDAKRAAVVAAFTDFQICIVLGRELYARLAKAVGHQIDERVMWFGQMRVHRIHHLLRSVRPCDSQHAGVHLHHQVGAAFCLACAQAACDDDLAVLSQGFANGVEAFFHSVINKAAGVDDDQISASKSFRGLITLGAELRQDQFRVGQSLGTSQAHETNFRCGYFSHLRFSPITSIMCSVCFCNCSA